MKKKRVLITGYNGFTGKYASEFLRSRGFDVFGLANEPANSAEVLSCDLLDAESVKRCVLTLAPHYVLHLAGLAFVGHGDAKAFYDVNLFGTLNLLEALNLMRVSPEKVIVASSANIYGTPLDIEVIDESTAPSPVNHYAVSKVAMEYMVKTWFDRMPIVVVRPFNYTGLGQDERFLVPKIVNHFKRSERVIELGNLEVCRDFSDVRDVVRAYGDLLVSNVKSEVVNVCSGQAYALKDIVVWAGKIAGYEIDVRVNPALVRRDEIYRLVGDNSKLKSYVGYESRYQLYQTIESMFQ